MTFGLPHARSNEAWSNGYVISRDKLQTFGRLKSHGKLLKNRKYEVHKPPLKPPAEPTMEDLLACKDGKLFHSIDRLFHYNLPKSKDEVPDYEECKLLGSLLDTKMLSKDEKLLTIDAIKKYKKIVNSGRMSDPQKPGGGGRGFQSPPDFAKFYFYEPKK